MQVFLGIKWSQTLKKVPFIYRFKICIKICNLGNRDPCVPWGGPTGPHGWSQNWTFSLIVVVEMFFGMEQPKLHNKLFFAGFLCFCFADWGCSLMHSGGDRHNLWSGTGYRSWVPRAHILDPALIISFFREHPEKRFWLPGGDFWVGGSEAFLSASL